jgi:serine/threonine protein kinase
MREGNCSTIAPSLKDNLFQGILSDGQVIAVKTLLGTTGHGLQQLHNEVVLLAELQHKNLVRLQGFCPHQNDTLLVYEYVKNGSLDNFLFGMFPLHFTYHERSVVAPF